MDYINPSATLAVDLINSYDITRANPEWLGSPTDLDRFLSKRGRTVSAPVTEYDLRYVRVLRGKLREVFLAPDDASAARLLNDLLAGVDVIPQFAVDHQQSLHLHFLVLPGTPLLTRLTVATALGLGFALQQYGKERFQMCAASPCQDMFIDTSRNRSRRFCSDRCANRINIAVFRARSKQVRQIRQSTDLT